jgi:hypothetical protein
MLVAVAVYTALPVRYTLHIYDREGCLHIDPLPVRDALHIWSAAASLGGERGRVQVSQYLMMSTTSVTASFNTDETSIATSKFQSFPLI